MNSHWPEVVIGIVLFLAGFFATYVTGGVPGTKPGGPPPLGFRVVLISFGLLFLGIGIYGLLLALTEETATPQTTKVISGARVGSTSVKEIGCRLHRDPSIISRLYSVYAANHDQIKSWQTTSVITQYESLTPPCPMRRNSSPLIRGILLWGVTN